MYNREEEKKISQEEDMAKNAQVGQKNKKILWGFFF